MLFLRSHEDSCHAMTPRMESFESIATCLFPFRWSFTIWRRCFPRNRPPRSLYIAPTILPSTWCQVPRSLRGGRVFSLSSPNTKSMNTSSRESLANRIIRPSFSQTGAGFFFRGKKDGSLFFTKLDLHIIWCVFIRETSGRPPLTPLAVTMNAWWCSSV